MPVRIAVINKSTNNKCWRKGDNISYGSHERVINSFHLAPLGMSFLWRGRTMASWPVPHARSPGLQYRGSTLPETLSISIKCTLQPSHTKYMGQIHAWKSHSDVCNTSLRNHTAALLNRRKKFNPNTPSVVPVPLLSTTSKHTHSTHLCIYWSNERETRSFLICWEILSLGLALNPSQTKTASCRCSWFDVNSKKINLSLQYVDNLRKMYVRTSVHLISTR